MKQKILNIVISLVITGIGILTYHALFRNEVKLAYIRTGVILNDYQGMIKANEQFQKELQAVQANVDTLKRRFEQIKKDKESATTPEETSDLSYQLGIAEYEYNNYSTTAQKEMQERQVALRDEVVNQINSFVKDYGKKNNYNIIFGATDQGSILYGQEQKDLTDLILKELNEIYSKGGSKTENE